MRLQTRLELQRPRRSKLRCGLFLESTLPDHSITTSTLQLLAKPSRQHDGVVSGATCNARILEEAVDAVRVTEAH